MEITNAQPQKSTNRSMAMEDAMARPLVHEARHAQHSPSDITLWLFCIYHTQNGLLLSCIDCKMIVYQIDGL